MRHSSSAAGRRSEPASSAAQTRWLGPEPGRQTPAWSPEGDKVDVSRVGDSHLTVYMSTTSGSLLFQPQYSVRPHQKEHGLRRRPIITCMKLYVPCIWAMRSCTTCFRTTGSLGGEGAAWLRGAAASGASCVGGWCWRGFTICQRATGT